MSAEIIPLRPIDAMSEQFRRHQAEEEFDRLFSETAKQCMGSAEREEWITRILNHTEPSL
jgi:Leu/Phe-tRNA-protein transferase